VARPIARERHGINWRWLARVAALALALVVVLAMTPAWLGLLAPDPARPRDFFQDWASARNLLTGRPVYLSQVETLRLYLGLDTSDGVNVTYNAHPPTSVLLALPLAALDYVAAGWWWNVLSLALLALSLVVIARELGWRPRLLGLLATVALLMVWTPLWIHTLQGQLGLALLALFAGAWAAGRRGRLAASGVLLGLAAAIKLFPLLLLGWLALRRGWRCVVAGLAALAGVSGLTLLILGPAAFVSYATVVLPALDRWRADWVNASLTGFFARLFAPDASTLPLLHSPALAAALTAASGLAVVALTAWLTRRRAADFDGLFALALTALLLLSALTWTHYFVVLLLPLAIWTRRLLLAPAAPGRWAALALTWTLMSLPPENVAHAAVPGGADGVATPLLALTVLALPFYGLLGFFAAQVWWLIKDREPMQ
jgi:hypothetical protein